MLILNVFINHFQFGRVPIIKKNEEYLNVHNFFLVLTNPFILVAGLRLLGDVFKF
jgi:hypothetical protein